MRITRLHIGLLTLLLVSLLCFAGMSATAEEAAEADAIADELHAQAVENELSVTPLLQSLESDSRYLTGLEHCIKSPESISRKVLLNAHDMEISLEEAVLTIHDALRYTFIIADDQYTSSVDEILKALVSHGYGVERFRNAWDGDGYKGINTNLTTPDGYCFEVQFHTQDSYDAKESKTHDLYEIVRRRGDLIEKKGADGQWHSAPELLWRFSSDDMSLIELKDAQIPPEERPE